MATIKSILNTTHYSKAYNNLIAFNSKETNSQFENNFKFSCYVVADIHVDVSSSYFIPDDLLVENFTTKAVSTSWMD